MGVKVRCRSARRRRSASPTPSARRSESRGSQSRARRAGAALRALNAPTVPHDDAVFGSQMSTQYVGVDAPLTSSTHWPAVGADTPGG